MGTKLHTPTRLLLIALLAVSFGAGRALGAAPDNAAIAWCGTVEIASGGGLRGSWRMNDSRYDYVDDPTVALDAHGAAAVAWVDQRRKDVFFQIYERNGTPRFKAPVNVSRTPKVFSWLPRIALSPQHAGDVYILWQEIVFSGGSHGGDIFFARSRDGGATFDAAVNLSNSVAGDGKGRINKEVWHNGSLDLAVAADGTLYAAWTEYEGPLWLSRSADRGATFSKPLQVPRGDDKPARAPALAIGRDGAVYLAWTVGEDERADIRMSTSSDGGRTFAPPRIVVHTPAYSDAPKIVLDSKGTLHLVHAESAGGPFDRYHVRYTHSRDGGQTFEAGRSISPVGASFPHLAIDGKDNVYVLWEAFPDNRWPPRGLALTVLRDGGGSFEPPVPLLGRTPNGGRQGLLMRKLALNRAGDVAVVSSSFEEGKSSRVWLARGAREGC